MRRLLAGCALAGIVFATPAASATNVGVSISIGNAPPPPVVVYREPPRWAYVPEEQVYVIADDDLGYDFFRVGTYFYIFNDGYWYRARSYRGPFIAIRETYVPRAIYRVPAGRYHWRHPHGMPPGQAKKMMMVDDRGRGHEGHGRGHRH